MPRSVVLVVRGVVFGLQATVLAEGVLCLLIGLGYVQDFRKEKPAPTPPEVALA